MLLFWFVAYVVSVFITKTYLYYFDPLKPHFCVVKLGFTDVYITKITKTQIVGTR